MEHNLGSETRQIKECRYCERLNAKYKKKHLSTKSWAFVKEDLVNDGPTVDSDYNKTEPSEIQIITKSKKKLVSKTPKYFNKDDAVYSKSLARTYKNRERLKGLEKELLSHPLVFSSEIKESLSPELYEDLVNILDPTLKIKEDVELLSNTSENMPLSNKVSHHPVSSSNKVDVPTLIEPCSGYHEAIQSASNTISLKKLEDHPSRDHPSRDEKRVKNKKAQINQLSKMEIVTKDFCDWVHNLGGEANNISETKINELFASSCETKPSLSIPVQVIELTTVPSELCVGGQYPLSADTLDYDAQKPMSKHSPKKIKYGSWYLDPKIWYQEHKSNLSRQPFYGLNNVSTDVASEMKNEEMNQVLSSLHAVKVFREFIEKKGFRNPEFLKDVPVGNDDDAGHNVADSSK
ncbi:protein FAM47E isoform X3 [Hydra vulgaris]|uniref:Protein FAM47E isoform X3 n=1 Tax=Hydra vulgaris TaxID=6087 RepID=A0ABM4D214_HYDVU